ncbi:MAG: helix-turn-helix domain-containing protein [Candidatus Marinimicrobia bacterium]|nr:helix-turn-helix domain-containing protein [Candidatus Neomarinimicrobiota bacterium]
MEKVFTKKEVAGYLKVSERTVTRLISEMEVPIYHVGRLIRIPVSSVNKLLKGPMTIDEQDKLITDLLEI